MRPLAQRAGTASILENARQRRAGLGRWSESRASTAIGPSARVKLGRIKSFNPSPCLILLKPPFQKGYNFRAHLRSLQVSDLVSSKLPGFRGLLCLIDMF